MRWFDLYLALIGVTLAFGALVVGLESDVWTGSIVLLVLAATAAAAAFARHVATPKVVLVGGGQRSRMSGLRDALDNEGFAVLSCDGPGGRSCPAWEGLPCPFVHRASAALIATEAAYDGPVPPCGIALGVPAVTVKSAAVADLAVHALSELVDHRR